MSSLRIAEHISEVVPPGLVSVLSSCGPGLGRAIVRHPGIRRVSFIGSVETGKLIQREAAEVDLKHLSLELGGKNPMLVFPDADLDRAAAGAVAGMSFLATAGQSCGSNSRVLVHRSVADQLVDRISTLMKSIQVSLPTLRAAVVGPLASAAQHQKTLRFIDQAKEFGAELICGGGRPLQFERGYFVDPALFANVHPTMPIAREEIFGPVMSVIRFESEAEAVQTANGSPYCLTAMLATSG